MDRKAENRPPVNYGVSRDKLSQVIDRITILYGEIAGVDILEQRDYLLDPNHLLEQLKVPVDIQYRFGSMLDDYSKLWIKRCEDLLYFRFDANLDRHASSSDINEGEEMERNFTLGVNQYLEESGLGQPLSDYCR